MCEKLIKIGAKVVRHAKYVTFQMAEVAVPRDLFAAILERIQWFGVPFSFFVVGVEPGGLDRIQGIGTRP